MFNILENIEELRKLTEFKTGDIAQVFGYFRSGDITPRAYRWRSEAREHNGGTVIVPNNKQGAWELCHNGSCSFSDFGIFDETTPADDALDAMANDQNITIIESFSNLNFVKRHKIIRNNITFDFHDKTITAVGVEDAPHNDPFSSLLHITGKYEGTKQVCTITQTHYELIDIFEVADSSEFSLYDWWICTVNNLDGKQEKEIDKLVMVTEIIDSTHVRVNYKLGWVLEKGRILTWQKVNPIENVHVKNMKFVGNIPQNDDGVEREAVGVQPLAIEFAVHCDVSSVFVYHTYWPVLIRRHNTHYVTKSCSLTNPTEVVVGGTGYLTQQIHCLYGSVRDCTTSNARHLNDFTGSAYCRVDNCHGDGDFHGAFVTHGQFEHDLVYSGCSGLLSFANSGPTWGSCAKRITVMHHTANWLIAYAKISDLTLQNVHISKTEIYENCGTFLVNADGAQITGCTGDKLIFTQQSSRSSRPNIVSGCCFTDGIELASDGDRAVKSNIITRDNY